MSWAIGYDHRWKRWIGYGVPAYCDHPDCNEVIDRGLSYVCGERPYGGDHGCGLYFCEKHRSDVAGKRRDYVHLCSGCYTNRGSWFKPKPEHPKWIRWMLTDESWAQWRAENPVKVEEMKLALEQTQ